MASQEQSAPLAEVPQSPEWSFYAIWVLWTILSVPIAFILDLLVLRLISSFVGDFIVVNGVSHITEDYFATYTIIPIVGLVMGVIQYFILRKILPHMGGWVLLTAGGWVAGMLLAALFNRLQWINISTQIGEAFVLMGLSIGVMQWLLLQLRIRRAGWWIVASLVGWGMVALCVRGNALNQYGLFSFAILPACTTAAALWFLLK